MRKIWQLWQSGPSPAADNMAYDDALLTALPRVGKTVLRFYGWSEPAATFGYSQPYAVVAGLTPLRPLIRRPTGGGLVTHDADWTYSLFFPPNDPWYAVPATTSYQRLHEWIRAAFARLGVEATLSTTSRKGSAAQCFVGAERFDLLRRDRKMAGAAQRRTRAGLLIQGSVQPPPQTAKADWQKAMCDEAFFTLGVDWEPFEADTGLRELALALARDKYSSPAYNQRR
ncbi:MAG: lipoate--protein ligase family protein [Limisphaerales bacterium]